MSEIAVSPDKLYELERFLYKEASFLDRPDLDKWMELYTEDGTYWMPAIPDQEDAEMHISLFYDDRVMMEVRRRNFVHPAAASKEYVVRASHIISNIQVTKLEESNGDCTVT
ncbi:MAG: aromatic-ring-hydroxylating dioxygenase subunit beta [Pseudomonadota bacterium]|nr:aromatic-ring-hydroxylating dioxygenase subunit beta [Pseudomonadota bacterium]